MVSVPENVRIWPVCSIHPSAPSIKIQHTTPVIRQDTLSLASSMLSSWLFSSYRKSVYYHSLKCMTLYCAGMCTSLLHLNVWLYLYITISAVTQSDKKLVGFLLFGFFLWFLVVVVVVVFVWLFFYRKPHHSFKTITKNQLRTSAWKPHAPPQHCSGGAANSKVYTTHDCTTKSQTLMPYPGNSVRYFKSRLHQILLHWPVLLTCTPLPWLCPHLSIFVSFELKLPRVRFSVLLLMYGLSGWKYP